MLFASQCASVVPVYRARSTVEFLRHETPDFILPDLWPPISPHLDKLSTRFGVACRSIQEASSLHGPKAATGGSPG